MKILKENFYDAFKFSTGRNQDYYIEVFKNPSINETTEVRNSDEYNCIRGVINGNDVYMAGWSNSSLYVE